MKAMNQKPELKEGQACMDETVELNANEVQAVSGGSLVRIMNMFQILNQAWRTFKR